jgi:hypothetical protein
VHFDKAQTILDRRELFIAEAGGDRALGLAVFAAQHWSPRREAFEDLWEGGRQFVYCAPNPGTLGAQKYGDYCLVIDSGTLRDADTAVFPVDTAGRYTDVAMMHGSVMLMRCLRPRRQKDAWSGASRPRRLRR